MRSLFALALTATCLQAVELGYTQSYSTSSFTSSSFCDDGSGRPPKTTFQSSKKSTADGDLTGHLEADKSVKKLGPRSHAYGVHTHANNNGKEASKDKILNFEQQMDQMMNNMFAEMGAGSLF